MIFFKYGITKMKKKVLVPVAGGTEEVEAIAVIDILSRGAGTAIDFALKIVRELSGEATANKIASDIVYNH